MARSCRIDQDSQIICLFYTPYTGDIDSYLSNALSWDNQKIDMGSFCGAMGKLPFGIVCIYMKC